MVNTILILSVLCGKAFNYRFNYIKKQDYSVSYQACLNKLYFSMVSKICLNVTFICIQLSISSVIFKAQHQSHPFNLCRIADVFIICCFPLQRIMLKSPIMLVRFSLVVGNFCLMQFGVGATQLTYSALGNFSPSLLFFFPKLLLS